MPPEQDWDWAVVHFGFPIFWQCRWSARPDKQDLYFEILYSLREVNHLLYTASVTIFSFFFVKTHASSVRLTLLPHSYRQKKIESHTHTHTYICVSSMPNLLRSDHICDFYCRNIQGLGKWIFYRNSPLESSVKILWFILVPGVEFGFFILYSIKTTFCIFSVARI